METNLPFRGEISLNLEGEQGSVLISSSKEAPAVQFSTKGKCTVSLVVKEKEEQCYLTGVTNREKKGRLTIRFFPPEAKKASCSGSVDFSIAEKKRQVVQRIPLINLQGPVKWVSIKIDLETLA